MVGDRLPLKQAELSVQRFQDMAVPHHLSLLQNHRSNIEKSLALGDWQKIKKEELNAMRVIKQIKNLLVEMDALREKLAEQDQQRFDELMKPGKDKAFAGMQKFAELQLKSPSTASEDDAPAADIDQLPALQQALPQLQTDFQLEQHQLMQRESCLEQMEHLQHEIQDLHGMFHGMHQLTQEQAASVQSIADNAEEALENVQQGEQQLRRALYYKKAMYPLVGAMLGTCVGGPIGLVAGMKAGGLAAVGCGILGFTGGSVLKSNPSVLHGSIEEQQAQQEGDSTETLELAEKSE
ncbi:syntaxin-17 [Drosophila busckii]|uniref:syntaxin-17 n=1 Tax=Drosophila busckii TaxID=30019 RepID=UPI00083EB518|nr:syntaxin-17 [Drosophila busckii]